MPYDGGDNNDGISIFDVTEPSSPRYAMLFPPDADASLDEDEEDLEDTILTASGYMRRYQHGEAAINLDDHPQVHALDSLPLLHIESLKSAWPHGNFQERVGIQFNTSKIVDDHNHAGEDAAVAKPATSLRKSALDTVIKRAFDSDGVSWLEDAEQLQGFTEHLRAYLYAHPDAIDHTTSCSLLERAFRECTEIDLSPFCGLVSNQVLGIVAAVSSSKVNLVLPDLETFGIEDLRKLLANNCIAELRIGKHQIDDLSDILSAIDGTSVTRLIIPEMYSRRFVKLGDFREDIRPVPGGGLYCKQWKSPLTRLPRPKQFPIVQMLHIISSDEESAASVHHSPWSRLINQEDPRSHNTGVRLVSLPMSEYLLSATNGVRALSGFLNGFTARFPSLISFEVGRDIMSTMERLSLRVSAFQT